MIKNNLIVSTSSVGNHCNICMLNLKLGFYFVTVLLRSFYIIDATSSSLQVSYFSNHRNSNNITAAACTSLIKSSLNGSISSVLHTTIDLLKDDKVNQLVFN